MLRPTPSCDPVPGPCSSGLIGQSGGESGSVLQAQAKGRRLTGAGCENRRIGSEWRPRLVLHPQVVEEDPAAGSLAARVLVEHQAEHGEREINHAVGVAADLCCRRVHAGPDAKRAPACEAQVAEAVVEDLTGRVAELQVDDVPATVTADVDADSSRKTGQVGMGQLGRDLDLVGRGEVVGEGERGVAELGDRSGAARDVPRRAGRVEVVYYGGLGADRSDAGRGSGNSRQEQPEQRGNEYPAATRFSNAGTMGILQQKASEPTDVHRDCTRRQRPAQ